MKIDNIKIDPHWSKSKKEIWDAHFEGLQGSANPEKTIPFLKRPAFFYSVAASVLIAVLFSSLAFFTTREEMSPRGVHRLVKLPDGSQVILNADSKLTYKPGWWYVSRSVSLQGEAFFKVKRGEKFEVHSSGGVVQVLGTSFNVFDRANVFKTTCVTGRVQVKSNGQTTTLEPGMQVYASEGRLLTNYLPDANQIICWTEDKFVFISTPLYQVIEEIERQYNIDIQVPGNIDYIYTGNFSKLKDPEQVLEIVGKPFGLKLKIK